ncbi:hypothetical protein QUC31_007071 [Theobroma cacao]
MASHAHLDDDDEFGGDFPGSHSTRHSGNKRSFGDLEDDEDDIFGSKKGNSKVEETAPGVATGMILSLRESLQNCKDALATCQMELEAAKSEIQKWHFAFRNEPFIPAGTTPEPKLVLNYLQTLKSSEEALKEQLEKAKKKEAAFIVTFAKREQEIAELKDFLTGESFITNVHCTASLRKLQRSYSFVGVDVSLWLSFKITLVGVYVAVASGDDLLLCTLQWTILDELSAVRDLKVQLKPPSMQARRLLLDPAIHEEFTRLKNLVEEKDKKVKELQENIAAVSFTPQSKMGKMLMAKCRTLQEENEEIGTQAEEGKMHELGMKLALQKTQNAELRSQFEALYKQMEGLTNDAERSNETVYILQEKLEEKDNEIKRLKLELQQKTLMEEENKTDIAIDTSKVKDEMVTDETGNREQVD